MGEALGEGEGVGLGELDGLGLGDAVGLADGLALGEAVGLADGLAVGLGAGVGLLATLTAGGGLRTAGIPPDPRPVPNGCGPGGLAAAKATTRPAKAAKASPSGIAAIEDRSWYPPPVEREELR